MTVKKHKIHATYILQFGIFYNQMFLTISLCGHVFVEHLPPLPLPVNVQLSGHFGTAIISAGEEEVAKVTAASERDEAVTIDASDRQFHCIVDFEGVAIPRDLGSLFGWRPFALIVGHWLPIQ